MLRRSQLYFLICFCISCGLIFNGLFRRQARIPAQCWMITKSYISHEMVAQSRKVKSNALFSLPPYSLSRWLLPRLLSCQDISTCISHWGNSMSFKDGRELVLENYAAATSVLRSQDSSRLVRDAAYKLEAASKHYLLSMSGLKTNRWRAVEANSLLLPLCMYSARLLCLPRLLPPHSIRTCELRPAQIKTCICFSIYLYISSGRK